MSYFTCRKITNFLSNEQDAVRLQGLYSSQITKELVSMTLNDVTGTIKKEARD